MNKPIKWEQWPSVGTCDWQAEHLSINRIAPCLKSTDEFAQKAEDTGKLVWITKPNSLRRTAKEKETTRKDLEDKIANVVNELQKNT